MPEVVAAETTRRTRSCGGAGGGCWSCCARRWRRLRLDRLPQTLVKPLVSMRGTGLPSSSDHNGADVVGRWAQDAMAHRPERQPMNQLRLAATPLPVVARASVVAGMWPESVVGRPTNLGGRAGRRRRCGQEWGEL
jgi:hypothetical protein